MFSFNTPHTPPTAKEDDLSFLRLIRSRRVGPATFHRLIAEHGSIAAALAALPDIAGEAGIEGYEPCSEAAAAAELAAGRKAHARLIRYDAPEYPPLLREVADAPPAIWVKGNAAILLRPALAIVGARNASSLGLRMARGMAGALAEAGIVTVSGLARGIDSAAHEASLKGGTIAVMAGGIDEIYPSENRVLAASICDRGCLVSEQPPGLEPFARHFPLRNRIISGLGHGVVVVEAAVKSGSLITARNALDQGREVLAVPGHPVDGRAGGCNQLIRDGAILVRNAEDVIEALPSLQAALFNAAEKDLSTISGYSSSQSGSGQPRTDGCQNRAAAEAKPSEDASRQKSPKIERPEPDKDDAGSAHHMPSQAVPSQAMTRPEPGRQDPPTASPRFPGPPPLAIHPAPQAPDKAPVAYAMIRENGPGSPAKLTRIPGKLDHLQAPAGAAGQAHPARRGRTGATSRIETQVLARLSPSPTDENSLIRDLGLPASVLAPVLVQLELSGRLMRLPGGRLALT